MPQPLQLRRCRVSPQHNQHRIARRHVDQRKRQQRDTNEYKYSVQQPLGDIPRHSLTALLQLPCHLGVGLHTESPSSRLLLPRVYRASPQVASHADLNDSQFATGLITYPCSFGVCIAIYSWYCTNMYGASSTICLTASVYSPLALP